MTPAAAHKKRKVSSISENPPSTSISNFTPPMQTHPRSSVQYSQPSHATCVSTSLDHRPDTWYPAVNQLPSSSSQSSQSGTYTFSSPPEADHLMRPPTSHATWDTRPSFAPGSQNVDVIASKDLSAAALDIREDDRLRLLASLSTDQLVPALQPHPTHHPRTLSHCIDPQFQI